MSQVPTVKIAASARSRLTEVLDALGCEALAPPPHAVFAAKADGVRVTLYKSGKLLLQGKGARPLYDDLAGFGLVPALAGATAGPTEAVAGGTLGRRAEATQPNASPAASAAPTIGSDETGKGDFFGPLVVAACFVEPGQREELGALGVQDSKKLTDARARKLAAALRERCPHEIVAISPRRYNELYRDMQNLNRLLAWAHGRALEELLGRVACSRVVVDQFAKDPRVVARALGERGQAVELVQMPRAESAEVAVAAASILARASFLDRLAALGERFDLTLPKGASRPVLTAGRAFVQTHGREQLGEVAKLHFKTAAELGP